MSIALQSKRKTDGLDHDPLSPETKEEQSTAVGNVSNVLEALKDRQRIIILTTREIDIGFVSDLKDVADVLVVQPDTDLSAGKVQQYDVIIFDLWNKQVRSKLAKVDLDKEFVVGYARKFEKADSSPWSNVNLSAYIKKLPSLDDVEDLRELVNAFRGATFKKPKLMLLHYLTKALQYFLPIGN